MAKCKCCGQEEVGYGTLLDRRGYCQGCCQQSINECEEQNARLQAELDKAIKQLKDYEKALKEYADINNWAHKYPIMNTGFTIARDTLKKWEDK